MGKYICILIFCLLGHVTHAQTEEVVKKEKKANKIEKIKSIQGISTASKLTKPAKPVKSLTEKKALLDKKISESDTISKSVVVKKSPLKKNTFSKDETSAILKKSKPHSPALAWKLSMVLPGLGQIYNGQWWKVPILYGGIAGAIYGFTWNSARYNEYKNAFSDYVGYVNQVVPEGQSRVKVNGERWKKVYPSDVLSFDASRQEWFTTSLKNKKDSYKRDRDLTIILMAGIYALNMIDALVSAHFYDFDISDDLSMGLRPSVNYNPSSGSSVGFACTLSF